MKKLIFACLAFTLISCGGETDLDKIGDAQICLNKLGISGTAAQVNECLQEIEGVESTAADNLRCAGGFMKEGFLDPQKIADAMDEIEGGTGSSEMAAFMGVLSFTSSNAIAADTTNAAQAFADCYNGGGKGTTLISSFAYIAMSLYYFMYDNDVGGDGASCGATPDPGPPKKYDLGCAATWIIPNGASNAAQLVDDDPSNPNASAVAVQNALGSVILATVNLSCQPGTYVNEDLCEIFYEAIQEGGGASNPRGVATELFRLLLGIP